MINFDYDISVNTINLSRYNLSSTEIANGLVVGLPVQPAVTTSGDSGVGIDLSTYYTKNDLDGGALDSLYLPDASDYGSIIISDNEGRLTYSEQLYYIQDTSLTGSVNVIGDVSITGAYYVNGEEITGDVTKEYVDASLNERDTSIAWNTAQIEAIDVSAGITKHYGTIYLTNLGGVEIFFPTSDASWNPTGDAYSGYGISGSSNNSMTINRDGKYFVTFNLDLRDTSGGGPTGLITVYYDNTGSLVEAVAAPSADITYTSSAAGILNLTSGQVLSLRTEGNDEAATCYGYTWSVHQI